MKKATNRPTKTTRFFLSFFKVGPLATKLSWLIVAILVLLPFHALLTTWAGSNFGHLDAWRVWKEILLLTAVPFVLFLALSDKQLRKWFFTSPVVNLCWAYVTVHIILGVWALSHHSVNKTALIYAFIINMRFLLFFVVCAVVASKSQFLKNNWRRIVLAPAAVVVGFGLVQKLFLPYDFLRHFGYGKNTIPAYQTVDSNLDYRRIQSTLRGANPLGAYLILIITVTVSWLHKNKKFFGIFLGSSLIVLFYTYSRSAEIGTALALVALAWWGIGKKISGRRIIALLVMLAILAGGGLYTFRNNQPIQDTFFHKSDSSLSPRSSNADRLQALKDGASDVIHQPLGRGPGTAGPASFRNDHPPRVAENYFLQIGQEVGVLGVVLFIAINFLVAKKLWARRKDQLAKILLASLVGITFVNLLSHAWTDDTLSYLWWGLCGIALAPVILENKRKSNGKVKQESA